jgi:hypothetical protein
MSSGANNRRQIIITGGVQGPPGKTGTGSDANFTFSQNSPASVWLISHPLPKNPSVSVVDTSGTQVHGTVSYPSASQIRIEFSAPFSGKAYLN